MSCGRRADLRAGPHQVTLGMAGSSLESVALTRLRRTHKNNSLEAVDSAEVALPYDVVHSALGEDILVEGLNSKPVSTSTLS